MAPATAPAAMRRVRVTSTTACAGAVERIVGTARGLAIWGHEDVAGHDQYDGIVRRGHGRPPHAVEPGVLTALRPREGGEVQSERRDLANARGCGGRRARWSPRRPAWRGPRTTPARVSSPS